ncbi:hypothetical protein MVEN_02534800 [Mycena venus]|uniref:Uncharacterized protein n=1 Tax=Mycena venus TaxID=2733690 RepID=A0A8H6WUE8_9AGAR|nr:hypothetical protein MVEN_02534800 [Mycena venus]
MLNNPSVGCDFEVPKCSRNGRGQQWMFQTADETLGLFSLQNAVNGVWLSYPGATNPDQLVGFSGATTQLSQAQALRFKLFFCPDGNENSTFFKEWESGWMLSSWPAVNGSPHSPVTYNSIGSFSPEQLWKIEYEPSS